MFALYNGNYIEKHTRCISLDDRGFLFGEGCFTTIALEEGHLLFTSLHQQRLKTSQEALQLKTPQLSYYDIGKLIDYNNAFKGRWRVKILYWREDLSLGVPCQYAVLLDPYTPPSENISLRTQRVYQDSWDEHKLLAYVKRLLMQKEAIAHGFQDVICLTDHNIILETSCSNIAWFDENTLYYPDETLPYLKGTYLKGLIPAAQSLGFKTISGHFQIQDLQPHHHVVTCNAMNELRLVTSIDGLSFTPLQKTLQEKLQKQARLLFRESHINLLDYQNLKNSFFS